MAVGLVVLAWCFLLVSAGYRHESRPREVLQKEVFKAGEGNYFCFRIPALAFTAKGTLLAFAEGRRTPLCLDHGDVHIVLKRSTDLGQTWSNLSVIHSESGHTIGEKYYNTKSPTAQTDLISAVCGTNL